MHASLNVDFQTSWSVFKHALIIQMYIIIISNRNPTILYIYTQANYVTQQHVPYLCLKMEKGYQPKGWLGIMLGMNLWFGMYVCVIYRLHVTLIRTPGSPLTIVHLVSISHLPPHTIHTILT